MTNYYVKNLETEKLELYFSKYHYLTLSQLVRNEIKRYFLFSRSKEAWISKSMNSKRHIISIAISAGLEDGGTTGEKISFAEKLEVKKEKAEKRALRFEFKSLKLNKESNEAYQNAKRISSYIVFGQPILVGHHSEGRHRRDVKRIDNSMRKSIELTEKSSYYADRSETAERTASMSELKNQVYLNNRIKENQAAIKRCEKYGYKKDKYVEKLEFYQEALNKLGGFKWNKENLKGVTFVKDRFNWYEVTKLNVKSVSCIERPREGVTWKRTLEYADIRDARFQEVNIETKEEVIEVIQEEKIETIAPGEGPEPEHAAAQEVKQVKKDTSIIQLSLTPAFKEDKILFTVKENIEQLTLF